MSTLHLPALVWLVLGAVVLGRASGSRERFAAVHKSIEVLVTAGLYTGALGIFVGVTLALFRSLQLDPLPRFLGLFAGFLPGLVPVLAVASVYDPDLRPSAQRFGAGITRVFFLTARFLLPPTLLVLLLVAVLVPTRFGVLSESRQTLVAFNAMLFAVVLLLVGAAPLRAGELAPGSQTWLRRGIAAVALLAAVVSAYALAAVLTRTLAGGLTVNRFTVIGWNVVNILTLVLLLLRQLRASREGWVRATHTAFSAGLLLYALWTVFVLVVLPVLARVAGWPAPSRPPGLPG